MEQKTIKESVEINATISDIWDAITDPKMVKQYFFDTNLFSDWKKGSDIVYSGTYEGKEYRDKGKILEIEPQKKLVHTYWSNLSGKPDTPENYYTITYNLESIDNDHNRLTITQTGNMNDESAEHSTNNWRGVLDKLKNLLQK